MTDAPSRTLPQLDFFLPLNRKAVTKDAEALSKALVEATGWLPASGTKATSRGRPKSRAKDAAALVAIVADILAGTQKARDRLFYRSVSPNTFTGNIVGYRAFKAALDWLLERGWIVEKYKGFIKTTTFEGDALPGAKGFTTRWQATDKLFEFVEAEGFDCSKADEHFEAPDTQPLLDLKRTSWREGRDKITGKSVGFPQTRKTEAFEEEVRAINEFLSEQTYTGFKFQKLRRVFNGCDNPKTYGWDKGGRLYATGDKNFQSLSKQKRAKITINGEGIIELDVRASHLTIFYGLRKAELDVSIDPYKVRGVPRWLVKAWLVKAFGNGDTPTRYPKELYEEFREKNGKEISTVYPIRDVTEAVLRHHPILKGLRKSGLNSLKLMFVESQIFIGVMEHLRLWKGIPSLPLHDGLIVPQSAELAARNFIGDYYEHIAGIRPYIPGEDKWDL